jgi:hypothetical protein
MIDFLLNVKARRENSERQKEKRLEDGGDFDYEEANFVYLKEKYLHD